MADLGLEKHGGAYVFPGFINLEQSDEKATGTQKEDEINRAEDIITDSAGKVSVVAQSTGKVALGETIVPNGYGVNQLGSGISEPLPLDGLPARLLRGPSLADRRYLAMYQSYSSRRKNRF